MSNFEEWFKNNEEFLNSNKISKEIAEVVWNSATASATHDFVTMVNDGKLILSFPES